MEITSLDELNSEGGVSVLMQEDVCDGVEVFKKSDISPLFSYSKDVSAYYLNFGKDFEGAARMITRILIEIYGVSSSTDVLDYQLWIQKDEAAQEVDEEFYRGGNTEPFHKVDENISQNIQLSEYEEDTPFYKQQWFWWVVAAIIGLISFLAG